MSAMSPVCVRAREEARVGARAGTRTGAGAVTAQAVPPFGQRQLEQPGSRSRDRRTIQPVPLVAIQWACRQALGSGLAGSGSGGARGGMPRSASRAANIPASIRCPRSLGCSRSTPHMRLS